MRTFKTFMAEKKLSQKDIKRALASIKPPKKKPTLPKAPWDDKEQKEDVQELTIAYELKEYDDDEDDRPHTHALVDKKGRAHGFAPWKLKDAHIVKDWSGHHVTTSDDHEHAKKVAKRRDGTVTTTKAVKLKKPMARKDANKMIGKSIKGHYHEAKEFNEISMGKMQAYGKAAAKDIEKHRNTVRVALDQPASPKKADAGLKSMKHLRKRSRGSDMYVDKMTGRSKVKPTAEATVDEISNAKMGQYVRKATDDAARRAMDAGEKAGRGDSKGFGKQMIKSRQRVKGVQKAMDKMDKNRLYGRH